MSTQHTIIIQKIEKTSLNYIHCAMINSRWHELPMSQTDLHGHKDVRAIEFGLGKTRTIGNQKNYREVAVVQR